MCYVVSLLGFPFSKVSPVPSPSLSLAGECVCVSYCEIAVRCVDVHLFVAKLGLDKPEKWNTRWPGAKTTQLLETLRHMPKLKLS